MKKNVIWWTGIINPELTDKYGKGSIDLETGTFTPLN